MNAETVPPIKFRWYFSVALALFLFALVGLYSARMAHNTTGYDEEQAAQRYATLAKLRETDRKTLTTADWIDKDKGVVRIPIDEAMAQEVPLLAAKPLTMGTAIPVAGAAPAATNAAAPATNAAPSGSSTNASSGTPAPPAAAGGQQAAPSAADSSTNAAPAGSAAPTPPPPPE